MDEQQILQLLQDVVRKQTGAKMDPQIEACLQQTMARFNDGSAFAAQESKQGFIIQEKVVGAQMLQLLEQEGLANVIAQLKSAGSFPPNTNAGAQGSAG